MSLGGRRQFLHAGVIVEVVALRVEHTAMTVRCRGAQADVGGQPDVLAEACLQGLDLAGGERPVDLPRGARPRHAEQQEGAHPGAQVRFRLPQQRGGRFLHDAGETGHRLSGAGVFGHEAGLYELIEPHVHLARQRAHVFILAQSAQGQRNRFAHAIIVPQSAARRSRHCQPGRNRRSLQALFAMPGRRVLMRQSYELPEQ